MFGSIGAGSSPKAPHNPNNDYEVPDVPQDGISRIVFSPTANHMACSSWDNTVRVWEVNNSSSSWTGGGPPGSVNAMAKAMKTHISPLLCTTFSPDGNALFYGSVDGKVFLWNLQADQVQQVASHGDGVRETFFLPELNILATGSWDKTLKYWDCRQANPGFTYNASERVYSMDSRGRMMVVALSDRKILIFDTRNLQKPIKEEVSPLKYLTRSVACFLDQKGYFVGSIEGRVAVQDLEVGQGNKSFTFKCHRLGNEVHTVNCINVHPIHGSFSTAGSDGAFHFWDKNLKRRLKNFLRSNESITAASFNRNGQLYAYAVCYDWRKGCDGYDRNNMRSYILIHTVLDNEINPSNQSSTNNRN